MRDIELHTDIISILRRRLDGDQLDEYESAQLTAWLEESELNEQFIDQLENERGLMMDVRERYLFDTEKAWEKLAGKNCDRGSLLYTGCIY